MFQNGPIQPIIAILKPLPFHHQISGRKCCNCQTGPATVGWLRQPILFSSRQNDSPSVPVFNIDSGHPGRTVHSDVRIHRE